MSKETKTFDFLSFCQKCPRSTTHCCTKKGNTVIVNKSEKDNLQLLFDRLINEKKIVIPDNGKQYTLFKEIEGSNDIFELELIKDKDDKHHKCPFFHDRDSKSLCLIHNDGKPLDCQLWPIAKFENGDNGVIYFDSNCSALNAKEVVPLEEVEKDLHLLSTMTDNERNFYYSKNNKHYQLKPVPKEYWNSFQEMKKKYVPERDSSENSIKLEFDKFRKKYVTLEYDSEQILLASKWVIGIFSALMITSLLNQVTYNVSIPEFKENQNFIIGIIDFLNKEISANFSLLILVSNLFLLTVLTMMFILDYFRMILPLPWIVKEWNKEREDSEIVREYKLEKNLPRGEVNKLVLIGGISLATFIILSIGFILDPLVYLFIFSFILLIDLIWYFFPRNNSSLFSNREKKSNDEAEENSNNREKKINDEAEIIRKRINDTFKELTRSVLISQNEILRSVLKEKPEIAYQMEDLFTKEIESIVNTKNLRLEEFRNLAELSFECEKKLKTLRDKKEAEGNFKNITGFDFLLCFFSPLAIWLLVDSYLLRYVFTFSAIILHIYFIYKDMKTNNSYIDYIKYLYLRKPDA